MFKNRVAQVKFVKENPDETGTKETRGFDHLGAQVLAREIAQDIVASYILIKGFKTLCGMLEHVVVTKVQ